MSSRLTLLFPCDQPELYDAFISEFRSADFQLLIARNLAHAKSILLSQHVDAIVLRHDYGRDDRPLATDMRRMVPRVPIFLLSEQAEPQQADIDSVWRGEFGDPVIARAMAIFFQGYFQGSRKNRPEQHLLRRAALPFAVIGPRTAG